MPTATAMCSERENFVSVFVKKTSLSSRPVLVAAALLFILVNIGCSLVDFSRERKRMDYSSCDHLTRVFKTSQPKPDIVMLGSSLMRMPFWLADRQHTNYVPDYEHYCWNFTLQNILRAMAFKDISVFNFAIDGEMASDAFLINKKLLQNSNHPQWIVYGIAPRDFTDSLLSKETKTPIFDSLFTVVDVWSEGNGFALSLNEKFNLTLEKLIFLFNKRRQIQNALANRYSYLVWKMFSAKKGTPKDLENISQISKSEQKTDLWQSSIEEYRRRYKKFDDKQLAKQQSFLKNLCHDSIKNGSKILLVNMPLTKENLALMPLGAYEKYRKSILTVTHSPGIYLLDLQDDPSFERSLYRDTAHLNANGAHRLNTIIADTLLVLTTFPSNQVKLFPNVGKQLRTTDGLASWWLAKAYYANPTPPEVVILGDSKLGPILGLDAHLYKKPVDVAGNHRSQVLEYDFQRLLGKKWKVLIGALPHATISDQAIISRALFSNSYKPKLVALTFSPEDFIDVYYNQPSKTEAYTFFSKYVNSSNPSMLRNVVKHHCDHYDDLQSPDSKFLTGLSSLALGTQFERLCPGEITINPYDDAVVLDNTEEYKSRYKYPFSGQASMQMVYLNSLLKYLKQQQIQVVAFNMPLTEANKKLLPENFWKYYDDRISKICRINGADYISADWVVLPFENKEFIDGVHLNFIGSLRWSRVLAVYTANKLHWKTYQELLARVKYLK